MGSASIDILFDKIDHEAAQFIQERTRVAMRLFLKEMSGGLSVTKAAEKLNVAVFTVRRWVFGRLVVAHFLRVFVTSFGWLDRPERSAGDDLERAYSSSVKAECDVDATETYLRQI